MRHVSTSVRQLWRASSAKTIVRALMIPALAATLATLAAAPSAEAQQPAARPKWELQAAARTRGEDGLRLFEAQKWSEAYEAFREADELYHANTLVLYMGHCRRNAGKLLEARALYTKVVTEEVPRGALEQFKKAQATARNELDALKARIPTVRVIVSGAGVAQATEMLDGAPVGVGDMSSGKEIDPGEHTIVVEAPGAVRAERAFTAREGGETKVEIALVPLKVAGPVKTRGSATPGVIGIGLGAAGLGVGAVTGIMAMAQIDDIKSRCRPDGHCPQADQDKADSAQTLVTVSTVGFVVGGAAIAAGAILLVLRPGGEKGEEKKAASAHVSIGLGSIGVGGSF